MSNKKDRTKASRYSNEYNRKGTKVEDVSMLNVLNYQKNYETLKIDENKKYLYLETDKRLLKDVRKIIAVRQNAIYNILNLNKSELSDKDCDQLDFRARIHGRANIVNQNSTQLWEKVDKEDRCYCGCNRAQGPYIPVYQSQQKLNVLGPGVLLFFLFVKYLAAALVVISLIFSVFGLTTNLIGKNITDISQCQSDLYCRFKRQASDQNKAFSFDFHQIQYWLGLAFCVIWIIILRVIKFLGKQKNRIVDQKLKTSSDYAIFIRNLPRGSFEQKELIEYFEGAWQKISKEQNSKNNMKETIFGDGIKNYSRLKSIQIIYNMEFSRIMNQKIFSLAYQMNNYLVDENGKDVADQRNYIKTNSVELYREARENLKRTYQFLLDLRKKFLYDSDFRKDISTACCLVQCKSQKSRRLFLKYFGTQRVGLLKKIQILIKNLLFSSGRDVIFKGNVISIERAPEPSDIMWQNCQKSYSIMRILGIYSATFLIILTSFGIILGLGYAQNEVKKDTNTSIDSIIITVINLAISIFINIVNKILWFALFYLLDLQYNYTLTDKTISQMTKVMFLTSINAIVLPILTNYILLRKGFIYGSTGLAGLVFDYQISCNIQLVTRLFNPVTILKIVATNIKAIRYKIIRYFCKNPSLVDFTKGSKQVNQFYEGEEFNIAENYVLIIGAILHAVFFCHLQPIILIIVTVLTFLFYWVNRVKLITVSKIPEMTQYLVFDNAIWMVGLVPLYYGAGSISMAYFATQENPDYNFYMIPSLISIGVGVLGLSNPGDVMNKIVRFFITKCKCIDFAELMGQYDEDDVNQSDSQGEGQQNSMTHLQRELKERIQKSKGSNRLQSYYRKSNALSLLGFQKILKGEDQKTVTKELAIFCESFFPKNQKGDREIVTNIQKKIILPKIAQILSKKKEKGSISQRSGQQDNQK